MKMRRGTQNKREEVKQERTKSECRCTSVSRE